MTGTTEVFGIGLVGSALAYLGNIPIILWTKIRAYLTVSISIIQIDEYSLPTKWIELWLAKYSSDKIRSFKVNCEWNDNSDSYLPLLNKDVVSNPGWFKYKGKKLLVLCQRREAKNTGRMFYDYTLTFFTRNAIIAKEFLDEMEALYKEHLDNKVKSLIYTDGEWKPAKTINDRSFDSIVLPLGAVDKIKQDIDLFISRKQLYKDLNINHKRGYLFEGLPGTGKSSIANAIATYLKWNLYSFNKTDIRKGTLSAAFSYIKNKSVVLLEDIDTYNINRDSDKASEDSGDWLNWLDGINSPDDCIFILTTNYVDKLDPALIRDGRIDFRMNFTYVTEYQIRESFKRFHLSASKEDIQSFVDRHKGKDLVMADIQNDLFHLYMPNWREE